MEAKSAFHYLNQIRTQAGMSPFIWNSLLERSSLNHAAYLSENRMISHVELPGKANFTGAYPSDRAVAQGYEARNITENHSAGDEDSLSSVDGLMGAIYHRFGFLDFSKDEIGIALTEADKGFNIVYNMGNVRLNRYCQVAINTGEGPFYENFCRDTDLVSAKQVDGLERETREKNPPIVVWPPKEGVDIPVVFYEEIPDPLPNVSVSGYPVSIQFNPAYYSQVNLLSFELYKRQEEGLSKVNPVHVMQKRNDPHRKFSENEFALFPLNRLEWGTEYYALVKYQHKGLQFEYAWEFTSKQLEHPLFVLEAKGEALKMVSDRTYFIYFPPSEQFPFIQQLNVESPYSVQVNVDWEDRNTVEITLFGEECRPVHFYLDGRRSFTVQLAQNENWNLEQNYPKRAFQQCR